MIRSTVIVDLAKELLDKLGERARWLINDPQKVEKIIEEARRKTDGISKPELWLQYLLLMFRLVTAYIKGLYREVSYETVILILIGILYFLFPFDVFPDPIYIDDAAVLIFIATKVKDELDNFACWERAHSPMGFDPVGLC